jgi:hypothetical protein
LKNSALNWRFMLSKIGNVFEALKSKFGKVVRTRSFRSGCQLLLHNRLCAHRAPSIPSANPHDKLHDGLTDFTRVKKGFMLTGTIRELR